MLTQDHQLPSLLSRNFCYFAITTECDHLNMCSYCVYLIRITATSHIIVSMDISPSHFRSRTNEKDRRQQPLPRVHGCGEGVPPLMFHDPFSSFCISFTCAHCFHTRFVIQPHNHTHDLYSSQQTEVTILGVNKLGIVREKTSSTVKYIPDNTWFFQLILMAYIWGIPQLYDNYSLATPPPFSMLLND